MKNTEKVLYYCERKWQTREANTIGSKANDITITGYMLEIKSEIEKIREQVQNIE